MISNIAPGQAGRGHARAGIAYNIGKTPIPLLPVMLRTGNLLLVVPNKIPPNENLFA
jgi:hypothetical protein